MANINLNNVVIGGRLTADPELKLTRDNTSVTSFTVAVNKRVRDAGANFLNVVAWRQTAETVCKYFRKGSSIVVIGQLDQRKWEDRSGEKHVSVEIVADRVEFVDSKSESVDREADRELEKREAPKDDDWEDLADGDDLPF